jgi:serine/threonine protein kinase
LKHLHSLGIYHNDLNPWNIMIDEGNNPVIVNLENSGPYGVPILAPKLRAGWSDPKVKVSQAHNDFSAFNELQI